ncbi:MAG: hypothetical protein ACJARE_003365 [Paracoccaceae bacterium]|jgi:hypothetical protein
MANHFVFRTARDAKLSPVQFDPDKLTQSRAWVAVTSVDEGGAMIAPHRHMPLIGEIGTVLHHISDMGAGGPPTFNHWWEAVARQHSPTPQLVENGHRIYRAGPSRPEMDADQSDVVSAANEGIRALRPAPCWTRCFRR